MRGQECEGRKDGEGSMEVDGGGRGGGKEGECDDVDMEVNGS